MRRPNMKILMVLTSHNQLGNTGRKTGFWLEEFAAPLLCFQGCRRTTDTGLTEAQTAASRAEERSAGKSDASHDAVQAGCGGTKGARQHSQTCRHEGGRLR